MWFSKVPGYIFDKQKTPYLTEAKDLSLAQSQYELAAYGVFVGSLYGIVGLAATLTYFKNNDLIYLGWLMASVVVIYSIFVVIRKYELIGSYIISVAPSVIVAYSLYEAFKNNSSFLTLTIFLCFFILSLKYGWRISRIVGWQRYHGYFEIENNNINKKA
ncbi:hypothetical protein OAK51_02845 [Alphaproteobacteria bacterium]|nr:hypothetical protein [Alphaproteobacteria bacterium]